MSFQTIIPKDKQHWLNLRKPLITSTEVAGIFGCSPWVTPYELYFRKRDNLDIAFEPNARVVWGSRLEKSIAEGVAEDEKLSIRKMDEFIFDPDKRIGSSFDFAIGSDGILEVKNVDGLVFRDGWEVNGETVEEPVHIGFQIQTQLYVSGRKYAILAALVGGNRVILIRREPDPKIFAAIESKVKQFWSAVDNNIEPAPDFQKDADFISTLYPYADPGKVLNAAGNELLATLVANYKKASDVAKQLQEEKDGYKAQILTIIGDAAKVIAPGYSISAGLIGPKHISYEREGYRDFRVFSKQTKEK